MTERWRKVSRIVKTSFILKSIVSKKVPINVAVFPFELGEEPPVEEIRTWAESFDQLMLSEDGRKVFLEFLRSEYSEENILFWITCEELKEETEPEVITEKANFIFEEFIETYSPNEVSLDAHIRGNIIRNMEQPTSNTFAEAQRHIFICMQRDSYPRFLVSQMFKTLAQLPEDSQS